MEQLDFKCDQYRSGAYNSALMTPTVHVLDRSFYEIISHDSILARIDEIAEQILKDYKGLNPVFLPVLNGSFMFAADLLKTINFPCEIEFINAKSYKGVKSSGKVMVETHCKESLSGRHIIIIEDIVDTGLTMQALLEELEVDTPASIEIASLLIKPGSLRVPLDIKYSCFKIENDFVVGYGLDYDGYGRNLKGIFQEKTIEGSI